MDQLDREIVKTREYGRDFGVVYGPNELKKRLISGNKYSEKLLNNRLESYKSSQDTPTSAFTKAKVEKASKYVYELAKSFPDIQLVTITGSVAAGYCRENDDIDLMVITKNNRLWINRLLLRWYVSFHKIPHRKFGLKENKDDLCFNLWIEEGEMRLPKNKQTLRNAMDTILMIPILNKNETYEKFLAENTWVSKFVRNRYVELLGDFINNNQAENKKFDIISIINWLVFWPQWWYMKRKISSEVVGLRSAFFHPSDRIRYARENNR